MNPFSGAHDPSSTLPSELQPIDSARSDVPQAAGVTQPTPAVDPRTDHLRRKLESRTASVAVVGLGYVGLPLVCRFARAGYMTYAYDVDTTKIEKLQRAESYLSHIDASWIQECQAHGTLHPTSDVSALVAADIILVCVPTPLTDTREPDLSYVEATARSLSGILRHGQLVVLESTTWPGTTREVVQPLLEECGLMAGTDFYLAYSPEREDPGNAQFNTGNTPKVVAGIDTDSTQLAAQLYGAIVSQVVPVDTLETAEATKLVENIYRAVNIALVNELKILFHRMGIDIWSVIDAAKTKPFGYQAFYPGPGLGGHCIPIDPFYLTWLARKHAMSTRFIELAGEINTQVPRFVMHRVTEAMNDHQKSVSGSRICLLGMAYKKDVDDCRESPSFALLELLESRGAQVTYNDPYVPSIPLAGHGNYQPRESQPLTPEFLASQDALVIVTDHSSYDWESVVRNSNIIVDTRNATRNVTEGRDRIYSA